MNKQVEFTGKLLQAFIKATTSANSWPTYLRAGILSNSEKDRSTGTFVPKTLLKFEAIYYANKSLNNISAW